MNVKKVLFVTVSCEIACGALVWGAFNDGLIPFIVRVAALTWLSAFVYANWDII